MSYSKEMVQCWLETGKSADDFFLLWWDRETYFDDEVQAVLLERHPSKLPPGSNFKPAYPIGAWSTADQFAVGTLHMDHTEVTHHEINRADHIWFARLTLAIGHARDRIKRRRAQPETILEKFIAWREERFMWEHTLAMKPLAKPEKYGDALTFIYGRQKMNQDRALGAIRKVISVENGRRRSIMETWAQCWLEYLGVTVTENSPNK